MSTDHFPAHSDALLTRYLEGKINLHTEREALEREFEQRRLELDAREEVLEFEHRDEVLEVLEARGVVWVQEGLGELRRLEELGRVRVTDEAALVVWLSQHLPELVRPRVSLVALTQRLRPEGAGVRDTLSRHCYPLPPGLEVLTPQTRLTFTPVFKQAENIH